MSELIQELQREYGYSDYDIAKVKYVLASLFSEFSKLQQNPTNKPQKPKNLNNIVIFPSESEILNFSMMFSETSTN